jgi:two-component system, OmpR family, phosphate regulon sensor histidine kinase PhoR
MSASFGRVAAVLLGLLLGGLIGGWIGFWRHAVPIGAGIGAVVGVAAMALADAARAARFLRWMRGNQDTAAPRDAGFWGEVGYRVERALRMREREVVAERERLSQFLEAIEASPNGVLLVDADDRIEWCNARAADHFGLNPVRDRRQKVTNLLRAPSFVAHLAAGEFDQPVEFAGPQGRMQLSVLVRLYGDGQKLILSHDITERERMETMRRDFVANVSHEIRTPLTVLAGFVETLASVPLSSSEQPRVFSLMRQQTSRIQTLVDDLLTLAQLEGSPRPAADRWINTDAVIATAMADAELLSAGRQDLHIDRMQGVEIAGAEAEVVSAMGNLLSNAVRYTPEGGRIDVRWSVRDSDGSAVFEVADTGIGIAREHLPRLTERFYRVDGSRSRDTGGTGLGLAIVKHVVQRHGGELQIESEPGKGSRFRLVFPAARVRVREDVAATQPGADRQSA